MFESLKQKIEELSREFSSFKEERDRLKLEARGWAEKRDIIHGQIKELRKEAADLRVKRDALNERVRELKGFREQVKVEGREKLAQILKLKEKMRLLMEKKPSRSMQDIQEEIESLEWKIQTTPLTVKEERLLIDQVRPLEAQLLIHKQIQKLRESLVELQAEEEALGVKAKLYHEKLSEFAEQSQGLHERMLRVLNRASALQNEADDMHQKYIEVKQKARDFHQRYVEILRQTRSLKQELHQVEEEIQAKRQLQLHKELEERAIEKLKRREKLTWEEFKFLAEQEVV